MKVSIDIEFDKTFVAEVLGLGLDCLEINSKTNEIAARIHGVFSAILARHLMTIDKDGIAGSADFMPALLQGNRLPVEVKIISTDDVSWGHTDMQVELLQRLQLALIAILNEGFNRKVQIVQCSIWLQIVTGVYVRAETDSD